MAWTYTSSDLTVSTSSGTLMKVRLLIGDTSTGDQQLQDDEIYFAITEEGDTRSAAALCASMLASEYARQVDKTEGKLSISLSKKFEHYKALSASLKVSVLARAVPHAGGITISEKSEREEDTDRVEPAFTVTLLDNPGISVTAAS